LEQLTGRIKSETTHKSNAGRNTEKLFDAGIMGQFYPLFGLKAQIHQRTMIGTKDGIQFNQQNSAQLYLFPEIEVTPNFYYVWRLYSMHQQSRVNLMKEKGDHYRKCLY